MLAWEDAPSYPAPRQYARRAGNGSSDSIYRVARRRAFMLFCSLVANLVLAGFVVYCLNYHWRFR